ncbi:MAG: SoxR reducing system RseC family protein [Clostridia bacterium]|nr:SoxR reducing system RseC family protein [Clostridia bacterium]
MRQPGEITDRKKDMLEITFCRPDACAACNACEGGRKEHKIWIRGEGRIGDIAVVDMPDKMVVKASAIAYGLPLIGLLAGMILGNSLTGGQDVWSLAGGGAGLAISLILLKLTEKGRAGREDWNPRLVQVLEKGEKAADLPNAL